VKVLYELVKFLEESLVLRVDPPLCKPGDVTRLLGRSIVRTSFGFEIRGDIGLINTSISELNLTNAKDVLTPVVPEPAAALSSAPLQDKSLYRKFCGRLMYYSQDRLDVQYAAKTAARRMSDPSEYCWSSLKRSYRYLRNRQELFYVYSTQLSDLENVLVTVDADWAACRRTRRSTSGCIVRLTSNTTVPDRNHNHASILHTSSRTQTTVALSTAEAEILAMISGTAEGIFVQALITELGFAKPKIVLETDSRAGHDALKRLGVGHMKHICLRSLFLQELIRNGSVVLQHIPTDMNVADLLTKPVSCQVTKKLLSLLSIRCGDEQKKPDN
jgi:hypothetical protein